MRRTRKHMKKDPYISLDTSGAECRFVLSYFRLNENSTNSLSKLLGFLQNPSLTHEKKYKKSHWIPMVKLLCSSVTWGSWVRIWKPLISTHVGGKACVHLTVPKTARWWEPRAPDALICIWIRSSFIPFFF